MTSKNIMCKYHNEMQVSKQIFLMLHVKQSTTYMVMTQNVSLHLYQGNS